MRNSSDLPPGGPTGPVFRLPNFGKPSRGRIVVSIVVGLVLLLIFSAKAMSSFYVNVLWFNSVGRSDVYWAMLRSKAELVAVFTAGCFVFLWVNLLLADRLAPLTLPNTPEDQTVIRIREITAKSRGKLRIALAALIAIMLGLPASSQWQEWTMFRNRQAFPVGDPLFKANVGFYVFRLPFAQFVVAWSFGALVLVTIITTAFHFINGSIRPQDRVQRVTSQAKVHLSVLLAIGTLLRAANYWLSKYELTSSSRGVVRGALYTDVNAQLPALNLMILVSLAVTALLLWNIRQKGWRLPVLAIGLWVVVALAVGTLYPAIIQRFVVQPNVSTRELPFIQRNIIATKTAMGIADVTRQDTTFSSISTADVTTNDAALRDVRQLDPGQMLDRFALDQGQTSFYTVNDLDVDRYSVDGRVQQVLVAARELNPAGIPNRTWVSRHLIYTHGCGVIAAPASLATEDGRPSYIDLKVTKPQIYFGDRLGEYAVVKTSQKEQACAGGNETSFVGNGGIKFNSFVRRVALAVNFGEFNLFGSNLITQDSQILLQRDVRSRVAKIAPFLHLDADPYAVVVDGQVKWVVDAFTTTNRYPYAETANVSQLTAGSGLDHSFNYVRNSVKAVVDAYSGEVTLYLMDTKDPIARMWSKAFPNLFAKKSTVSAALAEHFRYPEDLFRVQTNMFGRYQFDDATLFFNRDAAWSVAQAPANAPETATATSSLGSAATGVAPIDSINASDSNVQRFTPYFSIFHEPNAATDVGQFSMIRPFVPFSADDSRKELRSLMVVSSEPKTYGKITVYDIKTPLPAGPATVSAQFESEPAISQTITPLDQRGSRVTYGDLQLVPVGKGLVYIRPMFVQPDGNDRQVFVRKILAGYGDRSVIGDSLTSVISQLFPGFNLDLGDRVGRASSTPTTTVPGSPTTNAPAAGTTPAELLRQAEALFAQADAALAKSPPDFSTYQTKLSQARGLVQQALAAVKG
ncbi:MAG: hypothetical protein F2713_02405 [Actinobacteria bacterium]|uniref:Unannotated protein n=1 Tax=freshwater metagenome TaxID=449393 RepID=A0A6J6UHU2_9ZZZZ|nr:hypothetical protein [Actinomycetota bacterium]MSZ80408.1 hypothetical protein [Actinomycetota bacterium]MTB11910.1 hypothetical protein [Actinomycetota bacterium]